MGVRQKSGCENVLLYLTLELRSQPAVVSPKERDFSPSPLEKGSGDEVVPEICRTPFVIKAGANT